MSWEKITNVFLYMASLNENLIIIKIINFWRNTGRVSLFLVFQEEEDK